MTTSSMDEISSSKSDRIQRQILIGDLVLVLILAAAAYFRFSGIFWGDFQYLHPDERFLVWVTADMSPVHSIAEYFNTAISTLNPNNVGHGFFVYGTFPVILTRYLMQWLYGASSWSSALMIGRVLSTCFDLLTIFFIFLTGERLFNQKVGLLGAAFSAVAVMQIQQSHFYTSDSFATTFSTLALFFAAVLVTQPIQYREPAERKWYRSKSLVTSLAFGVAVGIAMACKVNTAPVAALLPAAWLVRILVLPRAERERYWTAMVRELILGGIAAFLVFRILQPYAFQGPSFFDILPNPEWIQNLKDLAAQTSGDVDFPPALQWARRPVTFSLQNMVQWGMGWPMGILAWAGFLWMGWRMIKGEWPKTAILWGWTAAYFIWQSLVGNPTMRYQLPIYPNLALMAGWGIYTLWHYVPVRKIRAGQPAQRGWKIAAVIIGALGLLATAGWAFAFTRIYIQPNTRVAASQWIYANLPGPVTVEYADGSTSQPLSYDPSLTLAPGMSTSISFSAQEDGVLSSVTLGSVEDLLNQPDQKTLDVTVSAVDGSTGSSGYGTLSDVFSSGQNVERQINLSTPILVQKGQTYRVDISNPSEAGLLNLSGSASLTITGLTGQSVQTTAPLMDTVRPGQDQEIQFQANQDGPIQGLQLFRAVDLAAGPGQKTLQISIAESGSAKTLASAQISSDFTSTTQDLRGQNFEVSFGTPVTLVKGMTYTVHLQMVSGQGALAIYGSAPANELSWDDGLPLRMDNYDPFGGIYQNNLNFEMYYDDDQAKLQRFETTMDSADYIFISSNRQWGTTTRVEERYPLTSTYYRNLLGCPAEQDMLWCYRVAEPGMFQGDLGFQLVKVFESYPNIGPITINDQFAEEAFTVYDHPKVLIFKKTADYDSQKVASILGSVDLTSVVHVIPGEAPSYPANLDLPEDRLAVQQAGGTWSQIFDTNALFNRYPGLALIFWYLVITLMGWACYPLLRIAMHGLSDHGFPLARIFGMLLLSWLVWIAGSNGISFSRLTISIAFLILLVANLGLAFWQRGELLDEIKSRKRYFLTVEILSLVLFLVFVGVRFGNPDLWHPYFGGEKPMDFAYLNAVLKSTTFPPYNPWFSGSYINYYYYGFVLVGVPIKWLGIVPSIAYNLFMPTIAATIAFGAFSLGWNLVKGLRRTPAEQELAEPWLHRDKLPLMGGLSAAAGTIILGNLGTIRMIWQGLMRLAAPGGSIDGGSLFAQISWMFQGLVAVLQGARLPYGIGDWYWIPSRALPGSAITEFPNFTFLYADPHAHFYALPLTILALAWALGLVFRQWRWSLDEKGKAWLPFLATIFVGALAIFSLRPTNTWDFPTYLAIGGVAIFYGGMRYIRPPQRFLSDLPEWARKLLITLGVLALFYLVGSLLFRPFTQWYALGYNKIDLAHDEKTPFDSYIIHWGVFLTVIISWMVSETVDWMASTPLSSLNKLRPYRNWLGIGLAAYLVAAIYLTIYGIGIAWFTVTLAVWCLVLLLRPAMPDAKRFVLFLIGTADILTLAVDLIVIEGAGRMNTVFKFYLQAWVLFAISAAASLTWLIPSVMKVWRPNLRRVWAGAVSVLVACALLYPFTAGLSKIDDRMSSLAPHTLDGMAYMQTSVYSSAWGQLGLSEDYAGIRWMQENVQGSPVIVEASTGTYNWGSRFSIYTGLPTIIGWDVHESQQRAVLTSNLVGERMAEVQNFYETPNREIAQAFLKKYNVGYIVVGQLERDYYNAIGLSKFDQLDGDLWKKVFQDGDTSIYEVLK